jgi:hypothetical protein
MSDKESEKAPADPVGKDEKTAADPATKPDQKESAAPAVTVPIVLSVRAEQTDFPLQIMPCIVPIADKTLVLTGYSILAVHDKKTELCMCRVFDAVTGRDAHVMYTIDYTIVNRKRPDDNKAVLGIIEHWSTLRASDAVGSALAQALSLEKQSMMRFVRPQPGAPTRDAAKKEPSTLPVRVFMQPTAAPLSSNEILIGFSHFVSTTASSTILHALCKVREITSRRDTFERMGVQIVKDKPPQVMLQKEDHSRGEALLTYLRDAKIIT